MDTRASTEEKACLFALAKVFDVTADAVELLATNAKLDTSQPSACRIVFPAATIDERAKPSNQLASRKRVSHLSTACLGVSGSIGQEKLKLNCRHVSPRTSWGLLLRGACPSRFTTLISIQKSGRWSGQPSNFAIPFAGLGLQCGGIRRLGSNT